MDDDVTRLKKVQIMTSHDPKIF